MQPQRLLAVVSLLGSVGESNCSQGMEEKESVVYSVKLNFALGIDVQEVEKNNYYK